jgi:hypothetical protein
MKMNCPPSLADIPEHMSKGELATLVYPHITYDTAIPIDAYKILLGEVGQDIARWYVWGYPQGSVFGMLLPLTAEAAKACPARFIGNLEDYP